MAAHSFSGCFATQFASARSAEEASGSIASDALTALSGRYSMLAEAKEAAKETDAMKLQFSWLIRR